MSKPTEWAQLPFETVIIVVEGKSDQQRLHLLEPRLQTIATGGSAVPTTLRSELKQLEKSKQLMIFTDPDVQGERIRRLVKADLTRPVIDLYLRRDEARSNRNKNKSLGIEHADLNLLKEVIHHGFQQMTLMAQPTSEDPQILTRADLQSLHLIGSPKAGRRRAALLDDLRMGYVNGKHLLERLNWHRVTKEQIVATLKRLEATDLTLKENDKK